MHVPFSDWTTDRTSRTATYGASAHGSCSRRWTSGRTSTRASVPSRSGRSPPRHSGSGSAGRRAPLKSALLDQRTVAGIGNIYADEALWYGRLHPLRPAGSLDGDELVRLHRSVRRVLRKGGIERQGSTLRDYTLPDGAYGTMQEEFRAYGRGGEPCDRCGTLLERDRRRRPRDDVLPPLPGFY